MLKYINSKSKFYKSLLLLSSLAITDVAYATEAKFCDDLDKLEKGQLHYSFDVEFDQKPHYLTSLAQKFKDMFSENLGDSLDKKTVISRFFGENGQSKASFDDFQYFLYSTDPILHRNMVVAGLLPDEEVYNLFALRATDFATKVIAPTFLNTWFALGKVSSALTPHLYAEITRQLMSRGVSETFKRVDGLFLKNDWEHRSKKSISHMELLWNESNSADDFFEKLYKKNYAAHWALDNAGYVTGHTAASAFFKHPLYKAGRFLLWETTVPAALMVASTQYIIKPMISYYMGNPVTSSLKASAEAYVGEVKVDYAPFTTQTPMNLTGQSPMELKPFVEQTTKMAEGMIEEYNESQAYSVMNPWRWMGYTSPVDTQLSSKILTTVKNEATQVVNKGLTEGYTAITNEVAKTANEHMATEAVEIAKRAAKQGASEYAKVSAPNLVEQVTETIVDSSAFRTAQRLVLDRFQDETTSLPIYQNTQRDMSKSLDAQTKSTIAKMKSKLVSSYETVLNHPTTQKVSSLLAETYSNIRDFVGVAKKADKKWGVSHYTSNNF
ncbi:hypothetical protein [Candidatus Nucleicultrix amoebiphila]|jgi:hypothetical protein|uniref:Uncharacterized protein n=1 Tax=Candidatus Nucleicultrix amoebiphila FS5 TaxID=1414854 RepID=A0A1W6N2Y1_9PROT|nr:hypothetical protein [Candidatus Nucleicultrix amoebiphila]ARN84139.1 hypothetical protein GQ61_00920 [Candidatus Nucleicultrix amoebiphila FS5]